MQTLTAAQYKRIRAKPSKHRNIRTKISDGGPMADSRLEARMVEFALKCQKEGFISNVRRQVPYQLKVKGSKICTYKADLVFVRDGETFVVDAKGRWLGAAKIKVKLMQACLGIKVHIFQRGDHVRSILEYQNEVAQ